MADAIGAYGADIAQRTVAKPGYSEHHTGLAIDFLIVEDGEVLDSEDESYITLHKRLLCCLPDFGFILRYPKGRKHITGYRHEPWHIRYTGVTLAKYIYENGYVLEEVIVMRDFIQAAAMCKKLRREANEGKRGGTAYPGKKALEICPEALRIAGKNASVVLVTGSSGKTTTARMLGNILQRHGISYVANREGANMTDGIAEAFLLRTDDHGDLRERLAVIECDEMYVPSIMEQLHVICVIVTNVTTDQPYRHPVFREVAKVIAQGIAAHPGVICCLNEADEGCRLIAEGIPNEIIRFREDRQEAVVDEATFAICFRFLSSNIYKTDAAAALSGAMALNRKPGAGLDMEAAVKAVCETKPAYGRGSSVRVGNILLRMENFKNPDSMNRILGWIEREGKKPDILFASANAGELTWMREYDWEPVRNAAGTIYVWGGSEDAAYLGSRFASIRLESLEDMERLLLETKKDTVLLCEYWALLKIWEFFADRGYTEHFWDN